MDQEQIDAVTQRLDRLDREIGGEEPWGLCLWQCWASCFLWGPRKEKLLIKYGRRSRAGRVGLEPVGPT